MQKLVAQQRQTPTGTSASRDPLSRRRDSARASINRATFAHAKRKQDGQGRDVFCRRPDSGSERLVQRLQKRSDRCCLSW